MSSVWGYHTLKNSPWLPWYLGGQHPEGSIEQGLAGMFLKTPPGTHCYILFTFGYHFYNFVNHFFVAERTNDWREMMLHHIAAVALYFGFILANCMGVGVFGAWLHDLADCWVTITRFFNSFEQTSKITLFTFVMMLFVWFYTRLFILPQLIYKVLIYPRVSFPEEVAHF